MKIQDLLVLGCLCIAQGIAVAAPIGAGTGVNDASVYIEWSDGFNVEFLVHFGLSESDTTTGLELMNVIEAATELETVKVESDWGVYLDGISYQGHSDAGFGGGELYWHYWENNAGSRHTWTSSMTGAVGRTVAHGDADAWIYSHGETPEPPSENPHLAGYGRYEYDPNDFATVCLDYAYTDMIDDWLTGISFDVPNTALGRPTVDTTGDDWFISMDTPCPVVPVYPAFRAQEIVYLGEGGTITLGFEHPVQDDENNPFGVDFIVFGNATQALGGDSGWINGNPATVTAGPSGSNQLGIVSVSQDGVTWYSFTNDPNFMTDAPSFVKLADDVEDGPFCGGFAPTLGRVYDPSYADASLGGWNAYWAEPTNPTLPLNPNLSYASFGGRSVARIAQTYGDSAGGAGFDLAKLDLPVDPETGLKWFQYVRIDDAEGSGSPKIDAVADVSCPGDYKHPAPLGDVNGDYQVDYEDFMIVQGFLGKTITYPGDPAAVGDLNGDGRVDQADLDVVTANLGVSTWG